MNLYESVMALIGSVGIDAEDVRKIEIVPGRVTFTIWARNDDGGIASVTSEIGDLPLSFEIMAAYEPPHEHGPDTHTHDDVDA